MEKRKCKTCGAVLRKTNRKKYCAPCIQHGRVSIEDAHKLSPMGKVIRGWRGETYVA